MAYLQRSPLRIVLVLGIGMLVILMIRGLNFGPLHTDVEVFLVWIEAYGFKGFIEHYVSFGQRHLLAAPSNALICWLFDDWMMPYHLLFQISRVLEGVFMTGIVYQLTRRRLLAVSAGLALMLTPIHLAALYQSIAWGIEMTLVLLLASTYSYLLSLQSKQPRTRRRLYILAIVCYVISIFSYESGIPWIGVNVLAGWLILHETPWRQRLRIIGIQAIPLLIIGAGLAFATAYVFEPWDDLAPAATHLLPLRVLEQMLKGLRFPILYLERWRIAVHDDYMIWMVLASMLGGGLMWGIARWMPDDNSNDDNTLPRDFGWLVMLAGMMLFCSVMVGASSPDMRFAYLNRITFGRSAGLALLSATLVFGGVYLLRRLSGNIRRQWQSWAMLIAGLVLVGPGFAWVQVYRDEAQAAYHEIDNVTAAVLDVRCLFYRPLHMVIVTEPDWVVSRFPDTNDLIIRQAQMLITDALGDATIDILKTGNDGYEDDFTPPPGSCELDFPSGMCLEETEVRTSRWTITPVIPNEDIVIVHYANDGTLTLLPQIDIEGLAGYNIATAQPTILKTNEARLALPIEQMPVPLSGHCPKR